MKNSYLTLHIAVLLAGLTGVFGKLISLNEGLLVWYRVLLAFIFLFFILKIFRVPTNIPAKSKWKIARVGMLLTMHWVLFYGSIKYSNISIGVVCFCLTSFFTCLLEPLINKRKHALSEVLLSMLTLVGIALIFHFDTSYQVGIALGVVSSVFSALYTIYNERLVRLYDTKLINYYQMLGGAIGLGVLIPAYLHFFPVASLIPGWKDTVYLVLLSLFCTVGLYIMFAEVLKKIPAFTVNLSFNLEPVYSILLAFIFFNEGKDLNFSFYIGLFLVMSSVVLQTLASMRK